MLIFTLTSLANEPRIGKCFSVGCGHNKKGRCQLRKINIYDNKALGLCLWHTETMEKRLIEPFTKGIEIGKKDGEVACLDKLLKDLEDSKAIKNPEEFQKWMQRHLPKEKK